MVLRWRQERDSVLRKLMQAGTYGLLSSWLAIGLSLFLGTNIVYGDTYGDLVKIDAPLAYWRFDDSRSCDGDVALDLSGNENHAVYRRSPWGWTSAEDVNNPIRLVKDTPAAIGGTAVELDGVRDWLETTSISSFGSTFGNGSTFEFWVKINPEAKNKVQSLFGGLSRGLNTAVMVYLKRDRLGLTEYCTGMTDFYIRGDGGIICDAEMYENIYDNRWHHVVWVINDAAKNDVEVFVDAKKVRLEMRFQSSPSKFSDFAFPFMIGDESHQGGAPRGSFAKVKLDEFAVYDHPLSFIQIVNHYNAAQGDLLAHEPFDYNSTTTLVKQSGGFGFRGPWMETSSGSMGIGGLTNRHLSFPSGMPFISKGASYSDMSVEKGSDVRRLLSNTIHMNAEDQTYYVSGLFRKEQIGNDSDEGLIVKLTDSSLSREFCLGIDGRNQFFLSRMEDGKQSKYESTLTKKAVPGKTYLLVAKIITRIDDIPDEFFLKVFSETEKDVFADTVGIEPNRQEDWDLTTTAVGKLKLDRLRLFFGQKSVGAIDEIRLGRTWWAVTGVNYYQRQAVKDAEHDIVKIIYDGKSPNKVVCDSTLRKMPDGSWVMIMLGGGDLEPIPENRIFITRSFDEGKTWSKMEPVDLGVKTKDPKTALVPSGLMVHNGRCTLFFSTHDGRFSNWRSWYTHSNDSCRTWGPPIPVPAPLHHSTFVRNHIVTHSGRILVPFQHYVAKDWFKDLRNGVMISEDGGDTWSVHGWVKIEKPGDPYYVVGGENFIVELADGTIAMLIRPGLDDGVLFRSDSTDGGYRWSKAYKTNIPNPSSKLTLYNLGDNIVAMLHNSHPRYRYPLSLWISFDGMNTWPYRRIMTSFLGGNAYPDGFVSDDKKYLHFAFDRDRYQAIYVGAKLPPLQDIDDAVKVGITPPEKVQTWAEMLEKIGMGGKSPVQATPGKMFTVDVLPDSTRVCYLGDSIKLSLAMSKKGSTKFEGVVRVDLVDYWGKQVKTYEQAVAMTKQSALEMTMKLDVSEVGYYRIDVKLIAEDATVLNRKKIWSVAVFDYQRHFPADSPLGTYTIGNVSMLAYIVPKGFYRNMAQMGARWGTIDTWWMWLEPEKGRYNWAYYDKWFAEAVKAGITPIPHLFAIPEWLSSQQPGDPGNSWSYPPTDWEQWGRFVYDFVTRYKHWLVYLRIWNEPNLGYWRGTPAEYARLVKIASQAAKRAKPEIKIIIEAVAGAGHDPITFLNAVHEAGAAPYWDVVAIHNYFFNNTNFPERTEFLPMYDKFIAWRNKNKPGAEVWDTEFACMADNWGGWWKGVGETHQAQWLGRTHVLGFAKGLVKMFWFPGYSWPDPYTKPYYNPAGLLRVDLTPRPAYVAYHTMASALSWAKYENVLSLPGGNRHGVIFKIPDGYVTALWSVDAKNACRLTLKFKQQQKKVSVVDIMGKINERTLGWRGDMTVDVSEDIVYVYSKSLPEIDDLEISAK